MSIQRQYSLPNCTLILDGWGNDLSVVDSAAGRPLLSILTSFECRFNGHAQPIKGGRECFEQLIAAASTYAQQFLSGVPQQRHRGDRSPVVIEQVSANFHRLTIHPQEFKDDPARTQTSQVQFDLMTVQLFDLVEAIDQFYADSQTLPDLALVLSPVPKRQIAPKEPIAQRAIPVALGVSSLAVAAIAFFYLPVPEFRPSEADAQTEQTTDAPSADEGTTPPDAATDPASDAANSDPAAETDETAADTPSDDPTDLLLSQAPLIVDTEVIDGLMSDLQETLSTQWTQEHSFETDLVYRVAVSENGDILGYKYVNDDALDRVDETPLPSLRFENLDVETAVQEAIAQYRVVFTPAGTVEVSPWHGRPPGAEEEPDEAAAGEAELGPEITDRNRLAALYLDLYDLLADNLEDIDEDALTADLSYRVNMTPDGVVVDYEALDDASEAFLDRTPLEDLREEATASDRQSEQGRFLVVITEDGVLQVSPWQGF